MGELLEAVDVGEDRLEVVGARPSVLDEGVRQVVWVSDPEVHVGGARDEPLLRVGQKLLSAWEPEHLLITLGEQGMMLFGRDVPPYHVPPRAREVYDLSGAGDTAIALFTLALVSGASPVEAAEISNHASGVVVAKLGTATVTPKELLASFEDDNRA